MVFCSGQHCSAARHLACLNPPLTEAPDGNWFCSLCQDSQFRPAVPARSLRVIERDSEDNLEGEPMDEVKDDQPSGIGDGFDDEDHQSSEEEEARSGDESEYVTASVLTFGSSQSVAVRPDLRHVATAVQHILHKWATKVEGLTLDTPLINAGLSPDERTHLLSELSTQLGDDIDLSDDLLDVSPTLAAICSHLENLAAEHGRARSSDDVPSSAGPSNSVDECTPSATPGGDGM